VGYDLEPPFSAIFDRSVHAECTCAVYDFQGFKGSVGPCLGPELRQSPNGVDGEVGTGRHLIPNPRSRAGRPRSKGTESLRGAVGSQVPASRFPASLGWPPQ
jgi:hypothetical protein